MARIVDDTNQLIAPRWAGDFGSPDNLMRGGFRLDPALFESITYTVTANGAAAAAATSITVDALPVAIPSGTTLNFTGSGEFALTTADAAAGATSLAVEALDAGIEDNDTASYVVDNPTPLVIPSGTAVGRTLAERDAGDDFGPAASGDTEVYLIFFDLTDAQNNPDFVAYRPFAGKIVKENYLPDGWDDDAAVVTLLRARYNMIRGTA